MLDRVMPVDEAGEAFDRGLPAAGDQLALRSPPDMNSQTAAEHDQHPQRRVGEHERRPISSPPPTGWIRNWLHRIDFGCSGHA